MLPDAFDLTGGPLLAHRVLWSYTLHVGSSQAIEATIRCFGDFGGEDLRKGSLPRVTDRVSPIPTKDVPRLRSCTSNTRR